jgi:hypothetical protein
MPRKSNTKWTDEDDRRLLELRAAGKSERVIALALRRSPGSVGTRLDLEGALACGADHWGRP